MVVALMRFINSRKNTMFFIIEALRRKTKMSGRKKFGSVVFFCVVLISIFIVLAVIFSDMNKIDFVIMWFLLNPLSFFAFGLLEQASSPGEWIFFYVIFTYVTAEMYAFLAWGLATIIVKIKEW